MAANTFLEITRSLRLYVPQLSISLAEQFVRDRYRRILDRRDWSGMRRESEFHLRAEKSDGTVTVVRDSASVSGLGTAWDSNDIGRQFKVGTGSPIYTIVDVDAPGQTLTLDRTMGITSGSSLLYRIFDGYVIPEADFLRFITVTDPLQGWRLYHWITSAELNTMDPQRNFFGMPYLLADRVYNVATAGTSNPVPQYEAWPFTTAARTLYYTYIRRGDDLVNDTDVPMWPIRSDIIVSGALADVARWPGTRENPNPYFASPTYWRAYEAEFEDKMLEIERRDEDIFISMLQETSNFRLVPMSANWIQSHVI